MKPYSIRGAKREEQHALTRLIVRATLHSGYDEAFIDRARPGLTVSLNGIVTGNVQVAEQSGEVMWWRFCQLCFKGSRCLASSLAGTLEEGGRQSALRNSDSACKDSEGRRPHDLRVTIRGRLLQASGRHQDRRGPFVYSPEVILPHFLFIVPPAEGFVADRNSN